MMSGSFLEIDDQELQRKADELAAFLKRKITEDPECLKRRYLWLAPAVLKHSKTVVNLLCRKLALYEPPAASDKEKDILLFETLMASYSVAMRTADQIVQNKTRYKENACRRMSEEPLGITLHICEELFDSLGHDFKTIFDIYASYQYLDWTHGKHSPEDIKAKGTLMKMMKIITLHPLVIVVERICVSASEIRRTWDPSPCDGRGN